MKELLYFQKITALSKHSLKNTGALENLIVTSIIALVNVSIIILSEKNDMLPLYSLCPWINKFLELYKLFKF
jgi:hypothetical protein